MLRCCDSCPVCQVIPPSEYVATPSAFEDVDLSSMKIHSPVRQQVSKTAMEGAYTVRAMEDPDIVEISVPAFQGLTVQAEATRSGTEKKQMAEQDWDGLERQFWRATMYNAPMYGADSPGTLFGPAVKAWNVAELPSLLHALSYKIPGVTLPFLYFGQWKSMFAFHKEDVNLYSINYLHVGAPKQWYGIPPRHAAEFERKAHLCYADAARQCKEYMRHKEQLVKPSTLDKWLVPYIHTRQHRGEFMLTWPTAYHQGFNYGFNCAESVNFASNSWIPFGTKCGRCLCKSDTVWVEVARLKERLRCLQWLYRAEQKQKQGSKQLTSADVPQSYVLDESSIWLGLPTEVPALRALALKYYPSDEQTPDVAGRSMAASVGGGGGGRSMTAASASSSSSYLLDPYAGSYNDMETNTYDESNGYMDDANASVCTYADCTQPLHPNQKALIQSGEHSSRGMQSCGCGLFVPTLMVGDFSSLCSSRHYKTVHTAAAREAAAASSAAAAAASVGATVAASALPVPAAATPAAVASAADASKKKKSTVSGSKRKADTEPAAPVAVAASKPAKPTSRSSAADAPVSKKQKQKQADATSTVKAAAGKRR